MNHTENRSLSTEIAKEIVGLYRYRWVWIFNIATMLKVRYRRSLLGFLWSMIGPFSSYTVIAVVFYFNSSRSFGDFIANAIPGFLMFNFVNAAINNSPGILLMNEHYLRKVSLPKSVFFFGGVAGDFVNYFFAQLVVMVIAISLGWLPLSLGIICLPFFWMLLFAFALGISLTIGTLTVFFRDISHIVPILMQIVFYMTPVLYGIDSMPIWIQRLILLNPFTYFLELYKSMFFSVQLPLMNLICICGLMAVTSLFVGLSVLRKNNDRIVYFL